MYKTFSHVVKAFFSPDKAQLNLGALKLEYNDTMREDVSIVLALIERKRVLFGSLDQELWTYVFKSLTDLLDELSILNGKLKTKGPKDVKDSVKFLVEIIRLYLEKYETDYIKFIESPEYPELSPGHKERNWKNLGDASEDLIRLRQLIHSSVVVLNTFAEDGEVIEWEEPELGNAKFWSNYANGRQFCPECGFNLYYSYDGKCPECYKPNAVFSIDTNTLDRYQYTRRLAISKISIRKW